MSALALLVFSAALSAHAIAPLQVSADSSASQETEERVETKSTSRLDRTVCRSQPNVGSRLQNRQRRVCMSQRDWDALDAEHAREARDLTQRNGTSVQIPPPDAPK